MLGMQFLAAVIALFFVVAVVLVLVERYLMQMAQQAKRDMMTGLYNKMTLIRLVDAALREGGDAGFLIIVDVDDFKRLNDAHGRPVGDKILIAVAGLLKERFEPYGVVGRLGGDEFCVYVEGLSAAQTVKAADGVCEAVAALSVAGARGISCSMGVASCAGRQEVSQAYAAADQALYRSKARGKNRCSFEGDERI